MVPVTAIVRMIDMNERIKELSKEAWAWAEQQEYTDATKEFSDILEQKFAELIVKECVTTLERHHPFTKDPEAYLYAISLIEYHFGVES